VYQWILPNLSEVLAHQSVADSDMPAIDRGASAEREWHACTYAMEQLLHSYLDQDADSIQGLVLVGPAPVFSHPDLCNRLQTVTFTAKPFNPLALMPFQLPDTLPIADDAYESVLPLVPGDSLAHDQFFLVLTTKFSGLFVLGEDSQGTKTFGFSFDPDVVEMGWRSLRSRLVLSHTNFLTKLDAMVETYPPVAPHYRTVTQFSQLLLKQIAVLGEEKRHEDTVLSPASPTPADVELLQAFAHEVRTPLTTIRTMTRLLLKRRDLAADIIRRLQAIDHECTEQIDRMELIFRAAELETSVKHTSTQLTAMSLQQVLEQSIPRWQLAASRRNLTLDVILPQQVPTVVSNPRMLDQVLTGLMENFTRSLPAGSNIQVQIIPAGDLLKLQLLPQKPLENGSATSCSSPCKSIGQLLTFQPETGVVSLNLAATKHLFQAIGGKLIVRQRPDEDEVLTIFLPSKE